MQLQKLLTFSGLTVELFEDASDSSAPSQPVVEDEPAMQQPSRSGFKHRIALNWGCIFAQRRSRHFPSRTGLCSMRTIIVSSQAEVQIQPVHRSYRVLILGWAWLHSRFFGPRRSPVNLFLVGQVKACKCSIVALPCWLSWPDYAGLFMCMLDLQGHMGRAVSWRGGSRDTQLARAIAANSFQRRSWPIGGL